MPRIREGSNACRNSASGENWKNDGIAEASGRCPGHCGRRFSPSLGGAHPRTAVGPCGGAPHVPPLQFALSTKSGCECVAHIAQAMTDMDPNTTLLSVDDIGAFDLISREAMLQGLLEVEGGGAALPSDTDLGCGHLP